MQRRHLVIFTRAPRLGTGKRRLAAGIGAAAALKFQRVSLEHTLRRLSYDRRWKTWLAVTPDRSGSWPRHCNTLPQGQGNLGDRLTRVIERLPAGAILIIGSDTPTVTCALIAKAFHCLDGHDAIFGPAVDGGYWAIGLRRRARNCIPFGGVRWSTKHALGDTVQNLTDCSIAFLPQLEDVDDAASLSRFPHWNLLHGPHFT